MTIIAAHNGNFNQRRISPRISTNPVARRHNIAKVA